MALSLLPPAPLSSECRKYMTIVEGDEVEHDFKYREMKKGRCLRGHAAECGLGVSFAKTGWNWMELEVRN